MKSRTPPIRILQIGLPLIALVVAAVLIAPFVNGQEGNSSDTNATQPPSTKPTTTPAPRPSPSFPHVEHQDGRLVWPKPRPEERAEQRRRMVRDDIATGSLFRETVTSEPVLDALRHVPRHEFVPAPRRAAAYDDTPLPIGYGQTISQPYIVALMTELLDVQPGDRILEIGTGSGYQAAILNDLTPYVCTIEIVEPLHETAEQRFAKLGYTTIRSRLGDGYDGWLAYAPFDAIIVTCAAGHVPPPLWQQLKPGGRMVIPIGGIYETQRLLILEKQPDGSRRSRSVLPVRFVPMTGKTRQK